MFLAHKVYIMTNSFHIFFFKKKLMDTLCTRNITRLSNGAKAFQKCFEREKRGEEVVWGT
jgi:hypothetical protein